MLFINDKSAMYIQRKINFFTPFAKYTEESNYFKLANIKHNQPHKILIILNILLIASIKTFLYFF